MAEILGSKSEERYQIFSMLSFKKLATQCKIHYSLWYRVTNGNLLT